MGRWDGLIRHSVFELTTLASNNEPLTLEQKLLATENAGLVWHAMKKLTHPSLDSDERLSACGIALIYAVRTFDPSKGMFVSHYMRWARAVLSADAGKSVISIPHRLRSTLKFLRKEMQDIGYETSTEIEQKDARLLFRVLTNRQQELMRLVYDLDMSQSEIARLWGTSRQNVSITHKKAVNLLKKEANKPQ